MTDLQHEEAETDRMFDNYHSRERGADQNISWSYTPPDDPPWAELDRLDLIFVGMMIGGGLMFLLFFFRVI
jgi:hypothetical protein